MLSVVFRLADAARDRARRRTWTPEHANGRKAEDLAQRYLQRKKGFVVVARNHRARSGVGELDIVAWDEETLVFVEVKSRQTDEFGSPDRAIGEEKRIRLFRAASDYARRAGVEWNNIRFDIVNVLFTEPLDITHVKDVFSVGATPSTGG